MASLYIEVNSNPNFATLNTIFPGWTFQAEQPQITSEDDYATTALTSGRSIMATDPVQHTVSIETHIYKLNLTPDDIKWKGPLEARQIKNMLQGYQSTPFNNNDSPIPTVNDSLLSFELVDSEFASDPILFSGALVDFEYSVEERSYIDITLKFSVDTIWEIGFQQTTDVAPINIPASNPTYTTVAFTPHSVGYYELGTLTIDFVGLQVGYPVEVYIMATSTTAPALTSIGEDAPHFTYRPTVANSSITIDLNSGTFDNANGVDVTDFQLPEVTEGPVRFYYGTSALPTGATADGSLKSLNKLKV